MSEITEVVARKVLTNIDAGLVKGLGDPVPGQMCIMAAINHAMGNTHGDKPTCVHPVVRSFDIRLNDSNWSSNKARAKGMRREGIAKLGSAGIDGMQFAKLVAFGSMTRILPKVLRFAASKGKGGEHDAALEAAAVACESAKDHAEAVEATSKASRATAKARANAYANADAAYAANADAAYAAYADAAYAANAVAAYADAAYAAAAYADAAYAAAYADAANAAYADAAYAVAANAVAAYAVANAYSNAKQFRDEILALSAEIACDALIACGSEGAQFLFLCDEAA